MEQHSLTEDDIYRGSSQFRLWSFTPERLAELRKRTNAAATTTVKAAVKRKRNQRDAADGVNTDGAGAIGQMSVDCLTVLEEQKLVQYYSKMAMDLADHLQKVTKVPIATHVKATAVQYIKRFYISSSPMTYHPKSIMPSALFFALKTENNYINLDDFVQHVPKATRENVLAPEYLIAQGLRFAFDVRHPHRGLKGGYMELLALASGTLVAPPGTSQDAKSLHEQMLLLPQGNDKLENPQPMSQKELLDRVRKAYQGARHTIARAAPLTDAYFLYTPAQVWLAAMLLVDSALVKWYLGIKLPEARKPRKASDVALSDLSKLLNTLEACAAVLKSYHDPSTDKEHKAELRRIDKKLYECQNPEKLDLVGLNKAAKRDGTADGELTESVSKRRRLEREKNEREGSDIFGPDLKASNKAGR